MVDYGKLNEIDEKIKGLYPNNAVLDGIVDREGDSFDNSKTKILWILKEANMRDFPKKCFDLCEHLRDIEVDHSSFASTWSLVLEISCAIIEGAQNWEDHVPEATKLLREGLMKQLAVIEVKKTFGGENSDQGEINSYYKKDKDIILAQIDAIAPDIIINASRVDTLFGDLKTGESKRVYQFDVAKFNNGLIINAYHPNQRDFSHKRYFELVRDCIKAIS